MPIAFLTDNERLKIKYRIINEGARLNIHPNSIVDNIIHFLLFAYRQASLRLFPASLFYR